MILPGAGRVWVATAKPLVLVPYWYQTRLYAEHFSEDYWKLLEGVVESHLEIERKYPRKTLYDFLLTGR